MNILFFKITLIFYLLGTVLYFFYLIGQRRGMANYSMGATGAGFLFHSTALIIRFFEAGYIPITNLHEALSFFSWALVLAFFAIEYRYRIQILGSFILPLAFITIISAAALPMEIKTLSPVLQSAWLGIHTTLTLLGGVAFALAFAVGIMYLIQERILKSKKVSPMYYRLPSLEVLDEINYRAISLGFPFLTLGIITGAIWAEYAWGSYWNWDPKQTWSLITWFIYAAILHGRLTVGWRGKRAAYLSILGFFVVIFTFLGVNFALKGIHVFD